MKNSQSLLLIFLIVPVIEIYLLLEIGGLIGAIPTILVIIGTAIFGVKLFQQQGIATWQRFQTTVAKGEMPAYEIVEGSLILLGGALLVAPGFFTDTLGLICLIPQLRKIIAHSIIKHHLFVAPAFGFQQNATQKQAIEGEYRKEDE